ncbi:lipopolysaccharide biosynthesis protein [Silanimonas lenta]|jgi:UDP-N-acetylmuramyl pentapeptide phosphotransferase/UDP-N-acetylglucosamine-1-phosphate transferase|uniref:glycosyltransferase family 4 protein n=1 Tax=Silanimonas lenta TaxID=265429 RepID=UPI002FDF4F8A
MSAGWEASLPWAVRFAGLAGVLLLAAAGTVLWRRWALRRGILDLPVARSSHAEPVPRGAGVAMASAMLLGLALLGEDSDRRAGVLASIALAAMLGLMDDLRPLPVARKLAGQGLAALPLALAFPLPAALLPFDLHPGLAVLGSLGLGVLFMNTWNFMDGINGIAAGAASAVALAGLGAAALGLAAPGLLAGVLLAACLGFLPFNAPRARVFMGDCGSHALGIALTALLLQSRTPAEAGLLLAAVAPFLVDVLGTLVQRARDREPLGTAHRRHLYQRLVRSGYSHASVAAAYAAWMAGNGLVVAMIEAGTGQGIAAAIGVGLLTLLAWAWLSSWTGRRLAGQGGG